MELQRRLYEDLSFPSDAVAKEQVAIRTLLPTVIKMQFFQGVQVSHVHPSSRVAWAALPHES